jgi:hypothetical protein
MYLGTIITSPTHTSSRSYFLPREEYFGQQLEKHQRKYHARPRYVI